MVSTLDFILYPLFILLPHSLRQLPLFHLPLPPPEYAITLAQAIIRNSNTASPPTSYEALSTAKPFCISLRFLRHIFCCSCHRLQQRPPLPSIPDIRHCLRHQLWLEIVDYLVSLLSIYSNLSIPPPVCLHSAPSPIFPEIWAGPSPLPTRLWKILWWWKWVFGRIIRVRSIGIQYCGQDLPWYGFRFWFISAVLILILPLLLPSL